jgi:SAM-dependent methyltransferase
MESDAERVAELYQRHAVAWSRDRGEHPGEQRWLDRFLDLVSVGRRTVLDIGCGAGVPIAGYLIEKGCRTTGVDSSSAMIGMCARRFPAHDWLVADMRNLELGRTFGGILAWDSLFHLTAEDQRRMFPIFGRHAAPGAVLMFTSGPAAGERVGEYRGEPLYHASLGGDEYRALLGDSGFEVVDHVVEDPECGMHTVWLARQG